MAQRFNAGLAADDEARPVGTLEIKVVADQPCLS